MVDFSEDLRRFIVRFFDGISRFHPIITEVDYRRGEGGRILPQCLRVVGLHLKLFVYLFISLLLLLLLLLVTINLGSYNSSNSHLNY